MRNGCKRLSFRRFVSNKLLQEQVQPYFHKYSNMKKRERQYTSMQREMTMKKTMNFLSVLEMYKSYPYETRAGGKILVFLFFIANQRFSCSELLLKMLNVKT